MRSRGEQDGGGRVGMHAPGAVGLISKYHRAWRCAAGWVQDGVCVPGVVCLCNVYVIDSTARLYQSTIVNLTVTY